MLFVCWNWNVCCFCAGDGDDDDEPSGVRDCGFELGCGLVCLNGFSGLLIP